MVRRHLTTVTTKVSSKGQIVLPAEIREKDDIRPGQVFEVERVDCGEYRLKRKSRRNEGVVALLLACPEKGWFRAMDRARRTDEIGIPELG
ncbi:MAG: AbrB/MazE/SpoVT family DNA-binding domain-containing protein [Verrucomicrobiia bacterium]